jgi:hypothetical protein
MTPKAKRPAPPASLGTAGKRCWKALFSDLPEDWELTAREVELLRNGCRQADLVSELETALSSEGIVVLGAGGQTRMNAVATELRQSRIALARLLGEIELPADAGEEPRTAKAQRATRAAQARWRRRYGDAA